MKSTKVLITGGAGFIGYHLADYLSEDKNCEIILIDNLSAGMLDADLKKLLKKRQVKFSNLDLKDSNSVAGLKVNFDYIYHLAAVVGVKNVTEKPDSVLSVNIITTLNLLDWMKRTQKRLKKFVFASTSEVYTGTARHYKINMPTDENVNICLDDIGSARTTYALSKIVGESASLNYYRTFGVPAVVVRYHNIYGPRMGCRHVIPELMLKAKSAKEYLEVCSTGHTRSFCYVSDATKATVAVATSPRTVGQILNIGKEDEEMKIGQLAKKIVAIVNPSLKIRPLPTQEGSVPRRCPDTSKLKELVGYRPGVSLKEGLKLTWQWYRNKGR
ncbi:MAG: hypothetical protein AMJ78_06365 [Omnitrophica WOR_2 bacterium SM23_29]|nr:MAG: hypothetical protein AMJ78_06365 [Omnitrophica WOR_2 bacterium SM23_29]